MAIRMMTLEKDCLLSEATLRAMNSGRFKQSICFAGKYREREWALVDCLGLEIKKPFY